MPDDVRPPLSPLPVDPTVPRRGRPRKDAPTGQPPVLVPDPDRVPYQICHGCGRAIHPRVKHRRSGYASCSCPWCGWRFNYHFPRVVEIAKPTGVHVPDGADCQF
jgi:hypothetical protein